MKENKKSQIKNLWKKYHYRTFWSEEDECCVAVSKEWRSLSGLGNTPKEALSELVLVVKDCIKDMKKNDEAIPWPHRDPK